MGPCRITKKAKLGVCGADVDTIVARNFLRMIGAGVSAHSDHGRTVAEVFIATAKGEAGDYQLKDITKLHKLAEELGKAGVPIIGTAPDAIDRAEDRERFQQMINDLGLRQPPNQTVRNTPEAILAAESIGYPLVVRPSYVLGGRAMEIVYKEEELVSYMQAAVDVSEKSPVLLDHFLDCAI